MRRTRPGHSTLDVEPLELRRAHRSDTPSADQDVRLRIEGTVPMSGRCPECGTDYQAEPMLMQLQVGPLPEEILLFAVHPGFRFDEVVDKFRRRLIEVALRQSNGQIKAAARLVGMKYSTFYTMMRRLGVTPAA